MDNFGHLSLTPNQSLKVDLDIIQTHVCGRAQSDFFRREIKMRKKLRRFKGADMIALREGVSRIAADITALPPVAMNDPSTHGYRDGQVNILRNGLRDLGVIEPGGHKQTEEDAAIQQDAEVFRKMAEMEQREQLKTEIVVYDMLDPTAPPAKPERILNLSKCSHVKKYLEIRHPDRVFDLWARCQGEHGLTPNKLSWRHIKTNEVVQGLYLEWVDLVHINFVNYIIVLQHHHAKDIPQPIAIPHPRHKCCAQIPPCSNLGSHLTAMWPQHTVLRVVRMPSGEDISSQTFDTHLLDKETNELCAFLEDK